MNHHLWRQEYEQYRYLRHTSDEALEQRLTDLEANLWATDEQGYVITTRDKDRRRVLLRLIVHVLLEKMGRADTNTMIYDEASIKSNASSQYNIPKLKNPFSSSQNCMSKFGERCHILSAYHKGILKITPASFYVDPSLNKAQLDNELEHFSVTPNEQINFRLGGLDAGGEQFEIPVQKLELFRYMMVPDFFVWCCGLGYDARLFQAFEADAALVIHDIDAFRSRLSKSVVRTHDNVKLKEGPLSYYDPYTILKNQLIPGFSKHFRYGYQNEYRFIWEIPQTEPLKPFFVEIGPLKDIANILEVI